MSGSLASCSMRSLALRNFMGSPCPLAGVDRSSLIADNAEAHRKIAEALLLHETLDGVHVMEILKTGSIQTPIAGSVVAAAPAADVTQSPASPAAEAGPGLQSSPSPA